MRQSGTFTLSAGSAELCAQRGRELINSSWHHSLICSFLTLHLFQNWGGKKEQKMLISLCDGEVTGNWMQPDVCFRKFNYTRFFCCKVNFKSVALISFRRPELPELHHSGKEDFSAGKKIVSLLQEACSGITGLPRGVFLQPEAFSPLNNNICSYFQRISHFLHIFSNWSLSLPDLGSNQMDWCYWNVSNH